MRRGLSQRVILYDEQISLTKQEKPVEEQRLLFEGRQLEDGSCAVNPSRQHIHDDLLKPNLDSFSQRQYFYSGLEI